jgi:hypothetical protein
MGVIRHECDKCGKVLDAKDVQRYIVRIEVFAADTPMGRVNLL